MIHLQDDFFDNPYVVRNIALKSRYACANDYAWPGYRCSDVPENITNEILQKIRSISGDKVLSFDYTYTEIEGRPNSSFQYVTQEFGDGIYHYDSLAYICIIYLALDAPVDSGTEICDDNYKSLTPDEIKERGAIIREFYQDSSNLIKRLKYDRLLEKVNHNYNPIMKVPNRFNRGIIFPATNFHRAQKFYGNSVKNARLTCVSFLR